jgi:hypothetical protein
LLLPFFFALLTVKTQIAVVPPLESTATSRSIVILFSLFIPTISILCLVIIYREPFIILEASYQPQLCIQ